MRRALAIGALALAACRPGSSPDRLPPTLQYEAHDWWPDTSGYPGVGAGKVLVTNSRDDTVSLFELSSLGGPLLEAARANVGFSPVDLEGLHHAAVHPSGEHYFLGLSQDTLAAAAGPHGAHGTGTVDGQVLKVRSSDNARVASVRVDRNPGALALSPDGKTLAVSHFDLLKVSDALRTGASPDARVLLVDAETLEVTQRVTACPAPHGLAFSPDGARLYAACLSDEVAVLTLADLSVQRVKVAPAAGDAFSPRYQPFGLAVSPLDGDVWVTCLATGEVRALDAATLTMDRARVTPVGGRPVMPAFSADGRRLWVPHQGDDRVSEVDPATGLRRRVLDLPAACARPHHALEAPGGERLLVVCEGDGVGPGRLVVLELATGAAVTDAATGASPDFVGLLRAP